MVLRTFLIIIFIKQVIQYIDCDRSSPIDINTYSWRDKIHNTGGINAGHEGFRGSGGHRGMGKSSANKNISNSGDGSHSNNSSRFTSGGGTSNSGSVSFHRSKNRFMDIKELNIGLIVPYTNFGAREYSRAINSALNGLHKSRTRKFTFFNKISFTSQNVHNVMMKLTPSPTGK